MKRIIHVKPSMIRQNVDNRTDNPTIVVKKEGKIEYAY
jgi:hypothetical protein